MAEPEKNLREILGNVEQIRKSLRGTQAHAEGYVRSQIGRATHDLKCIERELERAIRDAGDTE